MIKVKQKRCAQCNKVIPETMTPWTVMFSPEDGVFCTELCTNKWIGDKESHRPHPNHNRSFTSAEPYGTIKA